MMKQWLIPALAALALSGCVVVSHWQGAPQIVGVLTDNGKPVAGAEVRLIEGQGGQSAVATTDAEGRFTIGPLDSFEFFVLAMGERPQNELTLVVSIAGKRYEATGTKPGATVTLNCDLTALPPGYRDEGVIDERSPLIMNPRPKAPGLRCWDPSLLEMKKAWEREWRAMTEGRKRSN